MLRLHFVQAALHLNLRNLPSLYVVRLTAEIVRLLRTPIIVSTPWSSMVMSFCNWMSCRGAALAAFFLMSSLCKSMVNSCLAMVSFSTVVVPSC
jgi:hypothetical protein